MSATKHTPGPWETCGLMIRTARTDETGWDGGFLVADFVDSQLDGRDANAQLCSAAPELAEALADLVDLLRRGWTREDLAVQRSLDDAKTALDKAGVDHG